ncbi:lutropin-choriogonadotropic hormone receptor-like isoform X2 [Euwallacea fornicatus]|uniref:lutropin-choriogonadotropic hormone receptor-like isoform X2 n=1 Tax=Euwallacea fornicatus TaxID=995702 RepID=UPI00338F9A4E
MHFWSVAVCLCVVSSIIPRLSGEKSDFLNRITRQCVCETFGKMRKKFDISCHCIGADLADVPHNLTQIMNTLTIENAGLEVLKRNALSKYSETLRDLTLENLPKFHLIEAGVFHNLKQLQTLRIVYTGLQRMPNLSGLNATSVLHLVDLDHNKINKISSRDVSHVALNELTLSYNEIREVEEEAFADSQIAVIVLRGNRKLKILHRKAFRKLQNLRRLDLSDTSVTVLPTEGLHEIDILRIEDTYSMKVFPSVYNFKAITEAYLTYPYHCCAFKYPKTHDPEEHERHLSSLKKMEALQQACKNNKSIISFSGHQSSADSEMNYTKDENTGEVWQGTEAQVSVKAQCDDVMHKVDFKEVHCNPIPDAFNPCEDLMGNWGLRVPVWIIAHSSVIGNLFVLIVIGTSQFRLSVSKFLMCNLAVADLCIGVHLLLLAGIDAHSIGAYFNFAIKWQEGYGCNVAGFLTIFGNVLSVYTLAVITLERWCTITWAAHLNRRLKLRTSVKIMAVGWVEAIFMAFLPLRGISSYARTSICLPLESKNNLDAIYLSTLMIINCTAFTVICVCYGSMYRTIRSGANSGIANSVRNDQTVAKKMALLVFTDFACLSPIAFFGITALLGYPLITVTQTKILLVFVYPLNSCANPCLYAILTQQYRKDFFILMGRMGMCKEHAYSNRGAIRGKPVPYTSCGKRPNGVIRSISKSSNTNRNSLVTNVSNVNVDMPIANYGGFENGFRRVEYKDCTSL